ncbi:MAG: response regulator transcription factor [Syntrophorhabdales bacterium]|jgi:two-component system phosphate regulon response regulator PhoB/two-component system alkaline phosphatase synthesis response regulator PhoP
MQTNRQIVVVEDEPDILELISLHLKKERFAVRGFLNGFGFLKYLETEKPSLVLLDLMLPDVDGFEICKQLKARLNHATIPLIIITARSEETDRVLGLELGADDYMVKPFSPRELVARVKAVLRRTARQEPEEERIAIGDVLTIDPQKYEVVVEGKRIDLTTTEFRILQLLASKSGWVFSREKILTHLWGTDKMVLDRTVDVHIKHLREKMGKGGALIKNMRGIGYKLES